MTKALFTPATLFERLGAVIIIAIIALILWLIVVLVVRRTYHRVLVTIEKAPPATRRRQQRAVTALSMLANVARWVILVGAIIWALVAAGFGAKLTPVLAGAGIVGLAVGFGAQALVRDVISGLFLLLEGQYAVGDFIQAGGVTGRVVSVGLRVTVLQDNSAQLHYLPNGSITAVTVRDDPWIPYNVDLDLPSSLDAAAAVKVCDEVVAELASQYPDWVRSDGATTAAPGTSFAALRLEVSVQVDREWLLQEELPFRLTQALAAAQLPLPDGKAPKVYSRPVKGWEETATAETVR